MINHVAKKETNVVKSNKKQKLKFLKIGLFKKFFYNFRKIKNQKSNPVLFLLALFTLKQTKITKSI